jgi:hypothetical protein
MRRHVRVVSLVAAVAVSLAQAGAQQRGPSTPEERARAVQTAKSLQSDPLAPKVQEDREWGKPGGGNRGQTGRSPVFPN